MRNENVNEPQKQQSCQTSVIGSAYEKAYPKASKFMENADEKLKKIIDKLNDDEWETLRDRFADFYVHCL